MAVSYKIKFQVQDSPLPVEDFTQTIAFLPLNGRYDESVFKLEHILGFKLDDGVRKKLKDGAGSVLLSAPRAVMHLYRISSVKTGASFSPGFFRNELAGLLPALEQSNISFLRVIIPPFEEFGAHFESKKYYYRTFIEGIHYGNYIFNAYKSEKKKPAALTVQILCDNSAIMKRAIDETSESMQAVSFARDLQNEPGSTLYPQSFAAMLQNAFAGSRVEVSVFEKDELEKRNMNGLLGVGKGSERPPVLIHLDYRHPEAVRHIALIGKGITFDSGGISIKPSANMAEMKGDMSGAAVVAGVLMAAEKLKLPLRLTGVIAAAENLPSGSALKPGDIIATSSGKTIEIDDTDAEGRVALSDALHFALQQKPDCMIDLATLTGACVVALGEFTAGLFANDDELAASLYAVGLQTHERLWRLPLWDDYDALNKSDFADVKNYGGKWAGAISAAKFLQNWTDAEIPWAHLDIAGPASPHKHTPFSQPYFTGFGVRLLMKYLEDTAAAHHHIKKESNA